MKSIGNDIVALESIDQQRTIQNRFYSKFITPSESDLYQTPAVAKLPFGVFVWLLWSVKEAAYKYQKRLSPHLVFSPSKIIITHINIPVYPLSEFITHEWEGNLWDNNLINGEVLIADQAIFFRSIIQENFLASFVNDAPYFNNIYCGICSISDTTSQNQSAAVRQLMLNRLKSVNPTSEFKVDKALPGYPVIIENSVISPTIVSFAHHNQFISYCFKY